MQEIVDKHRFEPLFADLVTWVDFEEGTKGKTLVIHSAGERVVKIEVKS